MAQQTTTTTRKTTTPPPMVTRNNEAWDLFPFHHPEKIGFTMSQDVLNIIKGNRGNGRRFKVNLYPSKIHRQVGERSVPQPNEVYNFNTPGSGTRVYFFGPLREWNKQSGQFDTYGSYRTHWFVDTSTWSLHQGISGTGMEWKQDEYRIILEPFERAWNRTVIGIDVDGPVHINDRLSPTQFADYMKRINEPEKMGTALLQKKRVNQRKRSMKEAKETILKRNKRARTPSPTEMLQKRQKIAARGKLERLYTTTKLKFPDQMVFIVGATNCRTYAEDAYKMVKHTDLAMQPHITETPCVFFRKDKLEHYTACVHQRGMKVTLAEY